MNELSVHLFPPFGSLNAAETYPIDRKPVFLHHRFAQSRGAKTVYIQHGATRGKRIVSIPF
ncbi:hypothetical protein GCM10010981_39430 [Dyella nitratireducens]|uniref:Alpha/beta hydrolase n=1 Tax=Dyella nitratireducens TaxID=1849580 RepID=A0ABQ1GLW3_9GAMM|nr:hypothetical protein GCM10010981_39430 [Dyella nitratireducens]GLQ41445.1 hypothetical protein GCM10007902_12950 [Dyella nitratireducens]